MLTFMLPSSLAALSTQAAVGPVARDGAQHVTPDIVLAQLDIIAAASGGAMHAATSAAVDPFVFRLSIFVLAIFVGYNNVAGRLAASASSLYAKNLLNFLDILVDKKEKKLAVNWDDEIVKATALTKDGAIVHPGFQPKSAA